MNAQVSAFIEAINADEALKEQVHKATSAQAVIDLAAARGITLTEADVVTSAAEGADISDADLENASGGMTMWSCFCFGTMAGCHF